MKETKEKKISLEELPIYFHDSATQKKELFQTIKPGIALMYSCGPTVYDHAHIGNLRAYLLPDLIKRVLRYNGYKVNHVINFTDFGHLTDDGDAGEDKMMKALRRENKPITLTAMREVAEIYMESFKEDLTRLRIIPPDLYTPASEYIEHEIRLVRTLYEKGYAYETSDGVYFDITKFPAYGKIGNIDVSRMKNGARVEINPEKRHPADFALWKKGLLGWESKWGKGFPGWHIECTAMVFATLGKQIDIHTGGEDLQYTHHNGEIAQAEAVTGKQYVAYWLHNAHLAIEGTKIAKSLGNGIRLKGLVDRGYAPEVFRYWLLTGHYRSPMNFTFDALDASKQALYRLRKQYVEELRYETGMISPSHERRFKEAMNDDLNTAKALAVLWETMKDTSLSKGDKRVTIALFDHVLGLGLSEDTGVERKDLLVSRENDIPPLVKELVERRKEARETKNWKESDRLREAINLNGFTVEDTMDGQKIHRFNR